MNQHKSAFPSIQLYAGLILFAENLPWPEYHADNDLTGGIGTKSCRNSSRFQSELTGRDVKFAGNNLALVFLPFSFLAAS